MSETPVEKISIRKYLRDYNIKTTYGFCRKCDQKVCWRTERLIIHKRKCVDSEFDEDLKLVKEYQKEKLRAEYLGSSDEGILFTKLNLNVT